MNRHTPRHVSGLLPHQIVALGTQQPDDEKAFRAANATHRAIGVLAAAFSLRWTGAFVGRRTAPEKKPRLA